MKKDVHYEVEEGKRTVAVTEEGVAFVEDQLGIDNLYEAANTPLVGYLNNSLKAKELFKRDRDYIVNDGEVMIVDEFTGRVLQGRRYNEGMHQAIEAKEGVQIQQENQTLATITLQNYFRLYEKLSGHDRYGPDRGQRAAPDLQARRRPDPDEQADGPRRRDRLHLQDRGREVRRRHRRHRRAARGRPAGARRHGERREVRAAGVAAAAQGHPARGAQRQAARAGGRDHRQRRPQGRGHDRHQHGRSRHRHHARRQPRVHRRPRAARARPEPGRDAGGVRGRLGRRAREGQGRRRPRSTTRSSSSAGCTCSAPSGTSRGASTTSCAAAPAGRATRASRGSTSPSATT